MRPALAIFALLSGLLAATPSARASSPAEKLLRLADTHGVQAAIDQAEKARLSERDRDRVLGHLYLRQQSLPEAKRHLVRAVKADPGLFAAWLELAVVEHQLGHPKASLRALERGRSLGQSRPSFFALAADDLAELAQVDAADRMLIEGLGRFEGDVALLRAKVGLLFDLDAPEAARDVAEALFTTSPDPDAERRHFARRLVEAGAPALAAQVLEPVVAAAPGDLERASELAWAYARAGQPGVAARLVDPRRGLGDRFAFESAEQYRAAGSPQDALRVNAYVTPEHRRRGQRLVILVESGQLERAAAAGAGAAPSDLEDAPRFALAYAYAYTGRPAGALAMLDAIEAPERFDALPALRAALEEARR